MKMQFLLYIELFKNYLILHCILSPDILYVYFYVINGINIWCSQDITPRRVFHVTMTFFAYYVRVLDVTITYIQY